MKKRYKKLYDCEGDDKFNVLPECSKMTEASKEWQKAFMELVRKRHAEETSNNLVSVNWDKDAIVSVIAKRIDTREIYNYSNDEILVVSLSGTHGVFGSFCLTNEEWKTYHELRTKKRF